MAQIWQDLQDFWEKCEIKCKISGYESRSGSSRRLKRPTQKNRINLAYMLLHLVIAFLRQSRYGCYTRKGNETMGGPKTDIYEQMLAAYPDPMSRVQLRKAAHIGTRTSQYLLQSGLVPCVNTGKKTRCYKIAKKDVIQYLKDREHRPQDYLPPSKWYHHAKQSFAKPCTHGWHIDYSRTPRKQVERWYERQFKALPDVLDVKTVSALLGYNPKTVMHWCSAGLLKSIMQKPKYLIPKRWLIEFAASDAYNNIHRKSEKHSAAIEAILQS